MSERQPLSPYLGGPGARWAQLVLFLLHVALVISLLFLASAFGRIEGRLPLEAWQRWVFYAILGFCFLAFTWRGARIGLDLLSAWRSRPGRHPPEGADGRS